MTTETTTLAMQSVAAQTFTVKEVTKKVKGDNVTTRQAEATPEVMALVKRHVALADRASAIKAEQSEIKAKLADLMADQRIDKFVSAGKNRVSRSETTPDRINTTRLREEYPAVADAVTEPGNVEVRVTIS